MNSNEFGRRLGIGVRVAGRIAQQRAADSARTQAQTQPPVAANPAGVIESPARPQPSQPAAVTDYAEKAREMAKKSHRVTRAAGRGFGGFLRPFSRVGGILWLEVTGFFFGLFALYFAVDLWRSRLSYLAGPQHNRFLISAALTALFSYLCTSAFWRAGRK
jgi:hypothetical protein